MISNAKFAAMVVTLVVLRRSDEDRRRISTSALIANVHYFACVFSFTSFISITSCPSRFFRAEATP
jgi:hypothetical protein